MSRFYQTTKRDSRTKIITARAHNELSSHLRGWTLGVSVSLEKMPDGSERIQVRKTSGSGASEEPDILIAEFDTLGGQRLYATVRDNHGDYVTDKIYETKDGRPVREHSV